MLRLTGSAVISANQLRTSENMDSVLIGLPNFRVINMDFYVKVSDF